MYVATASAYAVTRREDDAPIGLCGLIRRDTLPDADIGYAYLPEFWGQGYAREAAAATLEHARRDFGPAAALAITAPHNTASMRPFEHLVLPSERVECLGGATQPSHVYAPGAGAVAAQRRAASSVRRPA